MDETSVKSPQISQAVSGEDLNLNLWQKLVGIVLSPNETMKYLVKNPDWKSPFFALSLSSVVLAAVIMPMISKDAMKSMGEVSLSPGIAKAGIIFGIVFAPLAAIFTWLIFTALIFYIGRILLGFATFREALSAMGYANLPSVFKSFLLAGVAFLTGRYNFSPGLTGLFPKNINLYLKALLSNIDIFNLWNIFLSILAVSAVFGFSKKKSAVIIFSLLGMGIMLQGAMEGMLPS